MRTSKNLRDIASERRSAAIFIPFSRLRGADGRCAASGGRSSDDKWAGTGG
jgi:hypothetical protein